MKPVDLLVPAVAATAPNARVVLKLVDGQEIDIEKAEHFCGLLVLTPSEPVSNEFPDDEETERLAPFADILTDHDMLTPEVLQRILVAIDLNYDEIAALLEECSEQGISSPDDLIGAVSP